MKLCMKNEEKGEARESKRGLKEMKRGTDHRGRRKRGGGGKGERKSQVSQSQRSQSKKSIRHSPIY